MNIEIKRDYNEMRTLIESAGSRFAQVSFVKKDGTPRTMLVQPASGKYNVKGEAVSEEKRKANEAWKANNPNLMAVWDVDRKAFRSINFDTVDRIAVNKVIYNVVLKPRKDPWEKVIRDMGRLAQKIADLK